MAEESARNQAHRIAHDLGRCDCTRDGVAGYHSLLCNSLTGEILAAETRGPDGLGLAKRPVAFRLPEQDGWIILQNEQAAQIEAEHRGVEYQGLYVRDLR